MSSERWRWVVSMGSFGFLVCTCGVIFQFYFMDHRPTTVGDLISGGVACIGLVLMYVASARGGR